VFIALATLATTTTIQVVKAQSSDESCAEGEHMTRIGCCPEGTTNIHSVCQDPEQHRQESDRVVGRIIAGAVCIAGGFTGHWISTVAGWLCQ
jgi:hypothetical protein